MKKFLISFSFVLAGSALWWGLSQTMRYSVRKWDAKFDSVVRHTLTELGVKNEDVIASVNELKTDSEGQYVARHLTVKTIDPKQINKIVQNLEQAGADVKFTQDKERATIEIKRGSRLYEEITFH